MKDIAGAARRAETKVPYFNAVCACVEDILSLQVPVDDMIIMLEEERTGKCLYSVSLHVR